MTGVNSKKFLVSKILVEKLFGSYSYTIPNTSQTDISKLLILYGDNGTGKTTILKLFFALLSIRERGGWKTKLAETKFRRFSVYFENGFEIGAARGNSLTGTYEYYIKQNGTKIKSVTLKTDVDNTIILDPESKEDASYRDFIKFLTGLNITTFLLSDSRKIFNSVTSSSKEELQSFIDSDIQYLEKSSRRRVSIEKKIELEPTIEKLIDWVRSKIISGSRVGERNSQVIFSDIIKNYITLSETETTIKDKNLLLKEVDSLEIKMPSYVSLGLIDSFDSKTIRQSIKKAKTNEQIKFLSTVISPFLEGINAKLNALDIVEKTLTLFIETINDYFTNKSISFNLNTGFILKQNGVDEIKFNWLSSGEKQILLLLINTITSADDATIFIIDEPEISLNIKWQRKLIKTLLAFSNEKNIQFILATHSFELLSAYKNNISKLVDNDAEKKA